MRVSQTNKATATACLSESACEQESPLLSLTVLRNLIFAGSRLPRSVKQAVRYFGWRVGTTCLGFGLGWRRRAICVFWEYWVFFQRGFLTKGSARAVDVETPSDSAGSLSRMYPKDKYNLQEYRSHYDWIPEPFGEMPCKWKEWSRKARHRNFDETIM